MNPLIHADPLSGWDWCLCKAWGVGDEVASALIAGCIRIRPGRVATVRRASRSVDIHVTRVAAVGDCEVRSGHGAASNTSTALALRLRIGSKKRDKKNDKDGGDHRGSTLRVFRRARCEIFSSSAQNPRLYTKIATVAGRVNHTMNILSLYKL